MVLNCVAYKCSNVHDRNKPIAFHTFPFNRPGILERWVNAIRREDWYPSKTSRICGEHFLPADYQHIPGCTRKLLKPDAVPSIFNFSGNLLETTVSQELITQIKTEDTEELIDLDVKTTLILPSTSEVSETFVDGETQTLENYNMIKTEDTEELLDIDVKATLILPSTKTFVDRETQPVENYNTTVTTLKRKIEILHRMIKRRDVTISKMKNVIRKVSKGGYGNENLEEVLKKDLNE